MCWMQNKVETTLQFIANFCNFGITFLLLQDSCRKDYLCVRHRRRQGVGIRDQKERRTNYKLSWLVQDILCLIALSYLSEGSAAFAVFKPYYH